MMTTGRTADTSSQAAGVPPELAARLARGEITLAEFSGLTREKLYEIARVGYRLLKGGQLEQARVVYRGLVAADPYDSVFRCHLAATHLRLGETQEAAREFDAALRFNRANVDALAGRGETRLNLGQLAEAIADLTAAVELDPTAARTSTQRARAILAALREAARQN